MKIGFLTNAIAHKGMTNFDDIAAWAAQNGFEDLEVGPAVPLDEALFRSVMDKSSIRISALIYCRNFLSSDKDEAARHIEELKKRIRFAGALSIEKVISSTGIDKTTEEGVYDRADAIRKLPARSLDLFEETFLPIVELAENCGVKIAFENCPLMGNIAISPVMWREIFARLDSLSVGLAYDPSHLIWQFIDPYSCIKEFARRIFHVHAKDTLVDSAQLSQCGILTDFSWWRYTIPGGGCIDWPRLLGELRSEGFNGTVSIEHEDRDYESDLESVKLGLIKGRGFLQNILESEA